jgi:hypothetical protein
MEVKKIKQKIGWEERVQAEIGSKIVVYCSTTRFVH